MRQFKYEAKKGLDLIKGIFFAETEDEAVVGIKEMGLVITSLIEKTTGTGLDASSDEIMITRSVAGRKFHRVVSNIPLEFRMVKCAGPDSRIVSVMGPLSNIKFHGHIKDISLGGLLFSVSDPKTFSGESKSSGGALPLEEIFEPGSTFQVKMVFPNAKGSEGCVALAKILRVVHFSKGEEGVNEPRCLVGAVFLSMDIEDKQQLLDFCDSNRGIK